MQFLEKGDVVEFQVSQEDNDNGIRYREMIIYFLRLENKAGHVFRQFVIVSEGSRQAHSYISRWLLCNINSEAKSFYIAANIIC